ncbi:hypothetical protein [Aquimarina algiphila]|uniref:hypothetical protein n=1 Tax=Aquimarina algiphila TaxID=2047982 RepID=UPI00232D8FD0|nr:hypothetical protein [Aquimarina algiphila]
MNKTTDNYKYQILTEIKTRDAIKYKELSDSGYSKGKYLNELLDEIIRGNEIFIPKDFEWDNEFFPIIIDLYEQGKTKYSPKEFLDKHKAQWSVNSEFLEIYNTHFKMNN